MSKIDLSGRNNYLLAWFSFDLTVVHSFEVRCTSFHLARIQGDKDFAENCKSTIDDVVTITITKVKNEPAAAGQ